MNSNFVVFILAFLMASTLSPSVIPLPEEIVAETAEPYSFAKEPESLEDIYEQADDIVLCFVDKSIGSYIEGLEKPGDSRLELIANAPKSRTRYEIYIVERWKSGGEQREKITITIPGGIFGQYKLDFGLPEMNDGDFLLLPLHLNADGEFIPILTAAARIIDIWDMNGDSMISPEFDEGDVEPLVLSAPYTGIKKLSELGKALDEIEILKTETTKEPE